MAILELAALGVKMEERRFTPEELTAKEAFLTSATTFIMPIVEADGRQIGDGAAWRLTLKLRRLFIEMARATAT